MNRNRRNGICKQFNGKILEQWGSLIGDPFMVATGGRARRGGEIQEQCGILKQQADRQLDEFLYRHRNWWNLSRQ